jgi:3-isopropylmalate dehydrogenase
MRIAVLPGDDIGPEIMEATLVVLGAAQARFGFDLALEQHEVGMAAHRRGGTTLPDKALQAAIRADGVLLGPGGMSAYPPLADGGINIPGTIRKRLDLYANLRPARARPGVPRAVAGLDCLIVRENTEGFYADRSLFEGYGEFMPTADCAMSVRLVTAKASRRIAKVAFAAAAGRRKRVGKRHVLQVTDGLFMREAESVAGEFPEIALREIDIDAMACGRSKPAGPTVRARSRAR